MKNSESTHRPRRARTGWSAGVVIAPWCCLLIVGWYFVERYEFDVNEPASLGVVANWPSGSALQRSPDRAILVLFLHPKCPCSRATIHELKRLLAATATAPAPAPDLIVVATVPPSADESWLNTDTIAESKQIAGAKLYVDRAGHEAARFGATTSGMVMLFDAAGALRFHGGITISRGHEGDSAGRDRLAELLRGERCDLIELPVFGCRLCLPKTTFASGQSSHTEYSAPAEKFL
jgi:hypothetical protein